METKEEEVAPKVNDETMETDPSEKPDNIVLRKLLVSKFQIRKSQTVATIQMNVAYDVSYQVN